MQTYYIRDKSGRGFTVSDVTQSRLLDGWGEDEDWDGWTVREWAETCEVGEVWKSRTLEIHRTK